MRSIQDIGPLSKDYPSFWAVLIEKVCQVVYVITKAITPKKKRSNGSLSRDEDAGNTKLASDGIIYENFLVGSACCGV